MSSTVVSIMLSEAYLCLDCVRISNAINTCPVCGSSALQPVSTWIRTMRESRDDARGKESSCR
jgi:hypothetical protein